MNIGIIGAGNIGGTLGRKWAAAGHGVRFGVRDANSIKAQAALAGHAGDALAVDFRAAVAHGEVVLFATPGGAMPDILSEVGDVLDGKILIDATNNVRSPEALNCLALLAQTAPHAPLYRAFNSLGWENFAQPAIAGQQVDLFYCGTAGASQKVVDSLIADIGLRPIYVGGLDQIAAIDGLTRLWFALIFGQGRSRRLAFKLVTE